jgi:6-phosphogluconolactonase
MSIAQGCLLVLALLAAALAAPACRAQTPAAPGSAGKEKSMLVYIGTYTGPKSKGIYLFRLDLASGKLDPLGVAGETTSPAFLAFDPTRRFLYAVNEAPVSPDKSGGVTAFAVDPATGKLALLNQQPSGGRSPCHLEVDPTGKCVLVANYSSGTAAVFPIAADGKLGAATAIVQHEGKGPDKGRQEGPHAHSVHVDAAGHAFVCDLGIDKIMVYRLDAAKGTLAPHDPPFATVAPGAGPRHFAFHPNRQFAYVVNEMGGTVTAFAYDAAAGTLEQVQTVPTLPADFKGASTCAEVVVHPSGKFLYASNRGHDSLAVFGLDPATGKLTPAGFVSTQGKGPRAFAIDPTGAFLIVANQSTHNLVVFRIDAQTGALTPAGVTAEVASPVCVLFRPE